MPDIGEVVEFTELGEPQDCECGGRSYMARLKTATSSPLHHGVGFARYCRDCKTQSSLSREQLERAKSEYGTMRLQKAGLKPCFTHQVSK